jgi:hypothetical protein
MVILGQEQMIFKSLADPMAIEQKRADSASPFVSQPSARLVEIEELHRRS